MYLFFDTETTGTPKRWNAPVTDVDNWPRMVQLAWMTYDIDGKLLSKHDYIIKPENYRIPKAATRVHGITTEQAMAEGLDLTDVLQRFADDLGNIEILVAHNIRFDENIVGAEYIRKPIPNDLYQKKRICTMQSTTDFCKIPGPHGYKWPKLTELHIKLFGKSFDGEHDAAADIEATARCYWELRKRNIL